MKQLPFVFLFLGLLLSVPIAPLVGSRLLWASGAAPLKVKEVRQMDEYYSQGFGTPFTIDFTWVEKNGHQDYKPGDLIELKRIGEDHEAYLYSPTHFPTEENPFIQITTHHRTQYRTQHRAHQLGYSRLSERLYEAKPGDMNFQ